MREGTQRRLPYWPVAGALVAVGAGLRVWHWAYGRGLWGDELYVAHNLRERGFVDLLYPLAYSQSAPPGWLWLERFALAVSGPGEQSLRLVPLLFGLALLPLVAYLGYRLLPKVAALAALLLVAVSPFLISYSNQVKQYSAEAFWVTLLVGVGILVHRSAHRLRYLVFWGAATAGATMSALAIPVSAVLATILVVGLVADRAAGAARWREMARFAVPAPLWLGVVAAVYVWNLRPTRNDTALRDYWLRKQVYPYRDLTDLPATFDWLHSTYKSLAVVPFALWAPALFLVLLVVGAVVCWRRSGWLTVAMLLTPLAIGLGAGALGQYPMTERLALYCVPSCLLLSAFAVSPPTGQIVLGWSRLTAGAALVGVVLVPQVVTDIRAAADPQRAYKQGGGANLADYRGALRYLSEQWREGDLVLATPVSWNGQSYYGPPADGYVRLAEAGACPGETASGLLSGRSRVWVFQATDWDEDDNAEINARLGQGGALSERSFVGARVVRVDLTDGAAAGAGLCLVSPPRSAAVR
ncbi:glycosyltransferase family 39 protein [Phytohabitans flavus]|uniref:glycosyltransferase family 39 protein n=1 Tax=Phytohabitans flavus TaxID=1076124 RepID=UPI003628D882